jgi:hypothetical protein
MERQDPAYPPKPLAVRNLESQMIAIRPRSWNREVLSGGLRRPAIQEKIKKQYSTCAEWGNIGKAEPLSLIEICHRLENQSSFSPCSFRNAWRRAGVGVAKATGTEPQRIKRRLGEDAAAREPASRAKRELAEQRNRPPRCWSPPPPARFWIDGANHIRLSCGGGGGEGSSRFRSPSGHQGEDQRAPSQPTGPPLHRRI